MKRSTQATGSTRTATRWSSSSAARALAALLLAGCATQRSVYFEAPAGGRRLTLGEARAQLTALVGSECARLQGTSATSGAARFTVAVDSALAVSRATLDGSTGDEQLDASLGTVAAALRLDAPATRLRVAYACAPAATATLEVR